MDRHRIERASVVGDKPFLVISDLQGETGLEIGFGNWAKMNIKHGRTSIL